MMIFRVLSWLGVFTGIPSLAVWMTSLEMEPSLLFSAFAVLILVFGVFSYLLAVTPNTSKVWVQPQGRFK